MKSLYLTQYISIMTDHISHTLSYLRCISETTKLIWKCQKRNRRIESIFTGCEPRISLPDHASILEVRIDSPASSPVTESEDQLT